MNNLSTAQLERIIPLLPVLLASKPSDAIVLSPSQMDTFDTCQRKWAWQYIAGIRSPPHHSAQLGVDIHLVLEHFLRSGTPPNIKSRIGKIAHAMIPPLPPPGIANVERSFNFRTRRGHNYTGKIDFSFDGRLFQQEPPQQIVAQDPNTGLWQIISGATSQLYLPQFPLPLIGDHKTTGDLQYAKTERELHNNVQAVIYAMAGFIGFNTDVIDLLWNYGTTKDKEPKNHPVRTRVYLPTVLEKFENVVEPLASVIVSLHHSRPHPLSLPPTPSACSAYGGCPHVDRCKLTDADKIRGNFAMSDPNATMSARMEHYPAAPNGNGFNPNAAPTFAPPAPQFAPQNPNSQGQPTYAAQPQSFTNPNLPPGTYAGQQAPQFTPPSQPQQGYAVQPPFAAPPPQLPQGAPPGQQNFAYPQPGQAPQYPSQFAPPPPGQSGGFAPGNTHPQAPQTAYSPETAPNPPESFGVPPRLAPPQAAQPTSAEAIDGALETAKKGKGRPKGSPNKELGLEGAVFMGGVYAALANPNITGATSAPNPSLLVSVGEAALAAYKAKFGA